VGQNSKNRILDAAEQVALCDGVSHFTLDAVAARAGLSKGGVLYNFSTKEALIEGMVLRLVEQTGIEMARLMGSDPDPHGRRLRAYLGVSFSEHGTCRERLNQIAAVLLSAVLTDPKLLEPVREFTRLTQEQLLLDGVDEERMHLVQVACDGLWMSDLLGFPGPEPERRTRLIQNLYEMTRG
jgi:AcrR family transcriptional regulator